MIRTEKDITSEVARQLRLESSQTQRAFWESVGSNQASGHWFEVGERKGPAGNVAKVRIPRPIRMLIFLRYVAKIDLDLGSPMDASIMIRVGREISAKLAAERADAEAKAATQRAKEAAKAAKRIAA